MFPDYVISCDYGLIKKIKTDAFNKSTFGN